jgi:hypothetical protein
MLERLRATVAALDGVLSIETNAATGSLLLFYDTAKADRSVVESRVEAAAGAVLDAPPPPHARASATKRRANRYAKYGMIGGLATSLVLAAAGKKRLHALTGGAFVACLGVHMAIHRRHLLK